MFAQDALAVVAGSVVGFSLGLTGVGSVLAVPVLVYGLGLGPHRAVCVSMVAIAAISMVGAVQKSRADLIEYRAGLALAAGGVVGAPLGGWINMYLPTRLLLLLFTLLVVVIAVWMLARHSTGTDLHKHDCESPKENRRLGALALIGLGTGFIAGLLGVGGGFLIVPALVLIGQIEIHRAVATSYLAVVLFSILAIAGHLLAGQWIPVSLTLLFAMGGVFGMQIGTRLANKLPGPRLQRIFALVILVMAILMGLRELGGP